MHSSGSSEVHFIGSVLPVWSPSVLLVRSGSVLLVRSSLAQSGSVSPGSSSSSLVHLGHWEVKWMLCGQQDSLEGDHCPPVANLGNSLRVQVKLIANVYSQLWTDQI